MRIKCCLFFLAILLVVGKPGFAQKKDYSIPEGYEDYISNKDYRKLVDQSVQLIAEKLPIDRVQEGTIFVKEPNGSMSQINLHNLILKWAVEQDTANQSKAVIGHFENFFSTLNEQKSTDAANYSAVREKLALRIYPIGNLKAMGGAENLIWREDLEGTRTVLVLDLEGGFVPVRKEQFRKWGQPDDAVFEAAQRGVNRQSVEVVKSDVPTPVGNIELYLLGNEDYAASYVLDLARNKPELVGEWGSVLAVPNKGIADIHRINKDKPLDFVMFIQLLLPTVEKFYEEHPQPISTNFYWYYKGKFKKIDVRRDATGTVNVTAPLGLSELIATEKK